MSYIGESGRSINIRLKEHKDSIRLDKPEKSAIGTHVYESGHNIDWNSARVIAKDSNSFSRKFKEAVLIKAANPGLNRNKGAEVPDIWWPLLLKREHLPKVPLDLGSQWFNSTSPQGTSSSITRAQDLRMEGGSFRN